MSADSNFRVQMVRALLEASIPERLRRSDRVELQQIIPHHWFSGAASECLSTYVAGYFYSSISVAQAYVDALSKFLCDVSRIKRASNSVESRWTKLHKEKVISAKARDAALRVMSSQRNDFHHLNRTVEQNHSKLEALAERCVNDLHAIESEVFAYSFSEGRLVLRTPEYWPTIGDGLTRVQLRQK